jgi:small subunit ribosomal protein S1
VEIEPGIDGLVHVSDMSWTRRVEHPSEVVQKGQEVEVMVLDVDAENKRISLGVKQLQDDPWPTISERFTPGVEAGATVARIQDKGVVVDLGDDIEGFVPASHSGVEDADRLEEYYAEGDQVDLRILESDAANRRIVAEVTEKPQRKSQEEIEAARAAREAAARTRGDGEEEDDDEVESRSVARKEERDAEPAEETSAEAATDVAPETSEEAEQAAEAPEAVAEGAPEAPESVAEGAAEADGTEEPESSDEDEEAKTDGDA